MSSLALVAESRLSPWSSERQKEVTDEGCLYYIAISEAFTATYLKEATEAVLFSTLR